MLKVAFIIMVVLVYVNKSKIKCFALPTVSNYNVDCVEPDCVHI